ncbi:sugar ABC transporter substrate-binding protein, partial [Enterococcus faecalis]
MKANWKKILMGGILLSASAVLLTACGGAEKTKAENESGSANKAAGDVKLWVDT